MEKKVGREGGRERKKVMTDFTIYNSKIILSSLKSSLRVSRVDKFYEHKNGTMEPLL